MSKEKKIRNHKVLDHPIIAMILLMVWGMAFYAMFGTILADVTGANTKGFTSALGAVVALLIHKLWFSPEFKGSVRIPKFDSKDVMFGYFGFMAIILIIDLINYIGHDVAFTGENLGNALMAGIGEEMFVRVLPISVMMRDWKDEKHVPFIAYATSLIFGVIHFTNMGGGAALGDTIAQVISAVGFGVLFAAVYLRTGNILLCMVLHTLHDLLVFMLVGATDSTGVVLGMSKYDLATSVIVGVIGIAIGAFLIRKSVRSDIVEVWKERWSME